jgi:hypothetical protein
VLRYLLMPGPSPTPKPRARARPTPLLPRQPRRSYVVWVWEGHRGLAPLSIIIVFAPSLHVVFAQPATSMWFAFAQSLAQGGRFRLSFSLGTCWERAGLIARGLVAKLKGGRGQGKRYCVTAVTERMTGLPHYGCEDNLGRSS